MDNTRFNQKIVSVLDLTSLNDADTDSSIAQFCERAEGSLGMVAAVCVFANFILLVKPMLKDTGIQLATVVNFPSGEAPLADTLSMIDQSLAQGADEIDVVVPYKAYLNGNHQLATDYIKECKEHCGDKALKVILETGELDSAETIYQLSLLVLNAGADFIKTSTGKVAVGATMVAAEAMLRALKEHYNETGELKGLKLSGGIKTLAQVQDYVALCERYFSSAFIHPNTFRIGASSLLNVLYQLK